MSFLRALSQNIQLGTLYGFTVYILHSSKKKMAAEKKLTFCAFRTPGKHTFAHSPLFKQHLTL